MADRLPSMPFFVGDYLGSMAVRMMSLEERGLYTHLLFLQWQEGHLENDPEKLARVLDISPETFTRVFSGIAERFKTDSKGRIYNQKVEDTHKKALAIQAKRKQAGSKGGSKRQANARSLLNLQSSPVQSIPNKKEKNPPKPPSGASGRQDPEYDAFVTEHLAALKVPYQSTKGDFVKLAALRKSGASLDDWPRACANYFATPMGKYTLADLASRYAVFVNSPLDRYGKPTEARSVERIPVSEDETPVEVRAEQVVVYAKQRLSRWLDAAKTHHCDPKCSLQGCPFEDRKRPGVPSLEDVVRRLRNDCDAGRERMAAAAVEG